MKIQLQDLLNKKNPAFSPSEMEIVHVSDDRDFAIFRYETYDHETGKGSKDYLYAVCDFQGNLVDTYSYEDLDLCIRVFSERSFGNHSRILELLEEFNLEQRK